MTTTTGKMKARLLMVVLVLSLFGSIYQTSCAISNDVNDYRALLCERGNRGTWNHKTKSCKCKKTTEYDWGGVFCSNCLSDRACQMEYGGTHNQQQIEYKCDHSLRTFNQKDTKVFNCKVYSESGLLTSAYKSSDDLTFNFYCSQMEKMIDGRSANRCDIHILKHSSDVEVQKEIFNCRATECTQTVSKSPSYTHNEIHWNCLHSYCNGTEYNRMPNIVTRILNVMNGPASFICDEDSKICTFDKDDLKLNVKAKCSASECVTTQLLLDTFLREAEPQASTLPSYDYTPLVYTSVTIGGLALFIVFFLIIHFVYSRYNNYRIFKEWTKHNDSTEETFDLSFQDITYTISEGLFNKSRKILDGVYGSVKQGQILALVGASGAGKTSLLDILAGRHKRGTVKGDILVGGVPIDHTYQLIKGYVLQENIMMATMTVQEYLMFNAQLRLPEHLPYQEKLRRVQSVMKDLGIYHLANRPIGSNIKRGLSGGEKRRVALGAELVVSKPIIFCDEITSGLDSYNAYQVVSALHNLAREQKKTIILSIHQPSGAIFDLIDKLVVLCDGKVAFSGEAKNAIHHFESLGFERPEEFNVPDFLLDLVVGASAAKKRKAPKQDVFTAILRKRKSSVDSTGGKYALTYDDITSSWSEFLEPPVLYSGNRQNRNESDNRATAVNSDISGEQHVSKSLTGTSAKYACSNGLYHTSVYKQLATLSSRAFKNFIRNVFLFPAHLVFSVFMGLILGFIFYKLPLDLTGTQNRIGAFFFLTTILSLVSMSSLELFIAEREVYVTERASGYYRATAYYFSRMIFDVIPLRMLPPIILGTSCYFLMGLRTDITMTFFWFIIYLTLFNISMGGICLCISSVVQSVTVGNMIFLCYNLFTMLFGGFLINVNYLPFVLRVVQYISPYRYTLEALLVNEVHDRIILFDPPGSIPVKIRAEVILEFFGFSTKHSALNLGCMSGIAFSSVILAAILLRYCVREKR